nr:uncharacterized protein LOC111518019 isoform X5 [Leptinotarsa decemlineata]
MAQAFITTHRNNFRWHQQERIKPIIAGSYVPDCNTDKDRWIEVDDSVDTEDNENFSKIKLVVKQMHLKRMRSVYQTDYCKEISRKQSITISPVSLENESFENELLESCKVLYTKKRDKILPPLPSSRQVNGYIRPSRLYTPLTRYQYDIGRVAYNLLNKS